MNVNSECELANATFRLRVSVADDRVWIVSEDLATGRHLADMPYLYRAARPSTAGGVLTETVHEAVVSLAADTITVTGSLAGLELEHRWRLPRDRRFMEETISLRNPGGDAVALEGFACALRKRVTDSLGRTLPEVQDDRFVAMPFRHRATDPDDWDNDFSLAYLMVQGGRELRVDRLAPSDWGYVPGSRWHSEGWAWLHGERTIAVMKLNNEAMEYSALGVEVDAGGVALCFAGCGMQGSEPSCLRRIVPGQTVALGKTRIVSVAAGYEQASYALRGFLDECGCGLRADYDPPVQWNELYDNPEWHVATPGHPSPPRNSRPLTYARDMLLSEAAKARDYRCEALYLDPGWDTALGSFVWGEEWLGDSRSFIAEVWQRYGLKVALHCPLATWASFDGPAVATWPQAARVMDAEGRFVTLHGWGGVDADLLCLGSWQYLDAAEERLCALCDDGVAFLMFDGNWWNGGCWNPDHGHPLPYTMEDHCRANLELAQRIHRRHPHVLIEMHDMIAGGSRLRFTPVYYKYGLPGSWDENWGVELMWQPMEDLRSGRARALYYYNLGCSIPAYLHVDLRADNEHCLVLWWYASTCRHLGIGGTHEDPRVAQAQEAAMQRYRRLDRFYKQGRFYGFGEEVHVHALPSEQAFVVNLFNLSDDSRVVSAVIPMEDVGLDRDRWYVSPMGGGFDSQAGTFAISRRMAPWSAQVAEVCSLGRPHRQPLA